MYRVLIVDDEPIICEGLRRTIKWDKFDCEVIGTAENGLEGVALIRELKPDILISDIAMNNMDGLAMIAAIRSERPDMEVTLLTGYRNFEYAQRAIKLGVTRFLLKPSKMEEIEEAIQAMTENLRGRGNTGHTIIDRIWNMEIGEEKYLYETFLKNVEAGKLSEANRYVIREALLFMLHHSNTKLSLSDVAEGCYVSTWHLSKLLNQSTGRGFFEILNIIRLEKSKDLLTQTDHQVQEISEMIGFQDIAHFSRIFKSFTGMSPTEYRHQMG